jgi:DNA polymerase elongation subunit (family B)
MFTLPFIDNYADAIKWGHDLEKELTKTMPKPMGLELEKIGRMVRFKKKKYAYWVADMMKEIINKETGKREPNPGYGKLKDYKEDPNNIIVRGIVLARRDNCKLLRKIYRNDLQDVMDGKSMQFILSNLMTDCIKLYKGVDIDVQEMLIVRTINSNYKSDNYFMKVFGEEIKKLGRPANPGDRLEYIICEGDGLLGQRLRLPEVYFERMKEGKPDKIDYRYYLEKLFMKSLEQLWYVGFRKEIDKLKEKYDQEDKIEIIKEMYNLSKKDKGKGIMTLWQGFNGDIDKMCEWLSDENHDKYVDPAIHRYLHNKFIKARQNKVTGRSVFNARITATPIKLLLKAIDMGKLEEYAKVVLTENDYNELFPIKQNS